MEQRVIPATGEALPVLGLGTWQSFDRQPGSDLSAQRSVVEILERGGGRLIDSSPMYGHAEAAVGAVTGGRAPFFYATKVWTEGQEAGVRQLERSMTLMGCRVLDLAQVHNLVDWRTHLRTLRRWKEAGRVRYIGVTHYTESAHAALGQVLIDEPLDFVQVNYSIVERAAASRLLPLAQERGVAVLVNRPFGEGRHLRALAAKPLPPWAAGLGIQSWSAFLLRYILGHSAVTCVIPATANPAHAAENYAAGSGPFPDAAARKGMEAYVDSL
ncbi:aldo/keto reductase [Flaviaesturariibacter amylovorans]|uniref:Aldo/keto reductase n=1 Tax=Flaviaesturariibacter amylovorans TaxID=1084520 RepID=A0ABP8GF40_9BACT